MARSRAPRKELGGMKIRFCLGWASSDIRKSFKSEAACGLFHEYTQRIDKFDHCRISNLDSEKKAGTRIWLCHTGKNAKALSSEALAGAIQNLRNSGTKELRVAVGPADGFSLETIENLKPDFLWSFGPMTYPHELAAVIAAEQIYRAYAIIHRLPYHAGH